MRVPSGPGAQARRVTTSPSSRKLRVLPSLEGDGLGAVPRQLEQAAAGLLLAPEIVPGREEVPVAQGRPR